ncbi:hypothetical protein Bpfe_013521, partial [Biomphalaria pfeifferi]
VKHVNQEFQVNLVYLMSQRFSNNAVTRFLVLLLSGPETKPVQDTWILHLKGNTDVRGQCSNVKTMYIAINIPEIQLQDAGKYVCRVYFPNETHPINTSTNLLVN